MERPTEYVVHSGKEGGLVVSIGLQQIEDDILQTIRQEIDKLLARRRNLLGIAIM